MKWNIKLTRERNLMSSPKNRYGRWLHIIGVAEQMSKIGHDTRSDHEALHNEIVKNLLGLNEVFSRDTDPISDLEGYAVRRLSQAIISLLKIPANIKTHHG